MKTDHHYPTPLIPFDAPDVRFESVGGKGENLVKLVQAGFSVPDGFLIPTSAYHQFTSKNKLAEQIETILNSTDQSSPEQLEEASANIRGLFSQGQVPKTLRHAVEQGWKMLGSGPVAVRSSATAEDLPDMSFAGQQDTFLNVVGLPALTTAVVDCWSSLWTARAIGYRTRNKIPHSEIGLSVVVQTMVESEVSGVLFTANPLTGLRREVVIDATFGLGEALVSGQVEPDLYVVDTAESTITKKELGQKAVVITGEADGGVSTREGDHAEVQALPDEAILRLANIGTKIEDLYQFPQDIEWAWKDDSLYILQSRPITSLYPVPEEKDRDELKIYFSFGAVQGLLSPMTPLGQEAIRLIFAGGASLFGFDHDHHTQPLIKSAGERLWVEITGLIRHPIGSKVILKIFPGIEPGSLQALQTLIDDPAIGAGTGRNKLSTFRRIARFDIRLIRKALRYARNPEESAVLIIDEYHAQIERRKEKYGLQEEGELPLERIPELFREIKGGFIYAIPEIIPGALPGLLPMLLLNRFSKEFTGSGDLALELTRGLPNNVTTEMDLVLWEVTQTIRADEESSKVFAAKLPETLVTDFQQGNLPKTTQDEIQHFLNKYGMRGLGEIDIGRTRWRENPIQVMQTIQSYLKIEDQNQAPDVIFERGAEEAARAQSKLEELARKTFGGRIKARIISAMTRRLRALGGLRESPKFYIIQLMGIIRNEILAKGDQLVEEGILKHRDDLFFLNLDELDAFAQGDDQDWISIIEQRRQNFDSEMRRMQIPRLMVSDGRAFYAGIGTADPDSSQWNGSPVSPGVVEGTVRVVFDPHAENLAPGEILVCPGTDPAWTPLFLAAGGLIMEVGGMMTHGAIVAREYGIPAVVGVNQATTFLKTGDRVRVDGSTGLIELLNGDKKSSRVMRVVMQ